MEFSENLKYLRNSTQCTQKKLAEYLGLSSNTVCEWEKNRSEPSIATIKKLAEFFDVSADYLIGLEDDFGARAATTVAPISTANTDEERELLELFRTLSPYLKGLTIDTVRSWAGGAGGNGLHKKA